MTIEQIDAPRAKRTKAPKVEAKWLPGATTVLRVQDAIGGSDALVTWAAKTAAAAAIEAIADGPAAAYDRAMAAVTTARDRGTRVHYGIEAMLRDEDHVPTEDTHPYWYGFAAFLVKERPEFIATERKVVNTTVGFGTTMDIVALLRGKVTQIDVKSGSVKDTHRLQLAAGDMAERWDVDGGVERNRWHQYRLGSGVSRAPVPLEAHYVLQLKSDGYELIEMEVGKAERDHFAYLVETYHRLKAWKFPKDAEAAA